MNNLVGIMQGRLSSPVGGRIQAFPIDTWAGEFARARDCGLDAIEWIVEEEGWTKNPVTDEAGHARLAALSRQTGVRIACLCADYFMQYPLVRATRTQSDARLDTLRLLIAQCGRLEIPVLDVPFVDASAINDQPELEQVAEAMAAVADDAKLAGVVIGLETNLSPTSFQGLLERVDHPAVRATYDTGNSAAAGFDPRVEVETIGRWIVNVHVKDRVRGGGTVALGTGAADLAASFSGLRQVRYDGPFILQVARVGDELDDARHNGDLVRRLWSETEAIA